MNGNVNKKLTFGYFFRRRAIPLLTAAAVLCLLGVFVFELVMMLMFDGWDTSRTYMARDAIHQSKQEHIEPVMDYWMCLISDDSMMEVDIGADFGTVITDPDTGELIGSPKFAVFAVVNDSETSEQIYYTCRDEDVLEFYLQYRGKRAVFRFDDIYLREDGISFRPGVVSVSEGVGELLSESLSPLEERDFTPADMSGYIPATAKLSIAMGVTDENKSVNTLMDTVVGKEFSVAERDLLHGENFDVMQNNLVTVGNKEYAFYSVLYHNFWETFGIDVLVDTLIVLAVAALVAFVWAKVAYNKYSVKYESEEYRRGMVNALAHDLKTPLMAISGYAENLQSGARPEKAEHYAAAIIEGARSMDAIIEDALQLSRLDNITQLSKEKVDIPALVGEMFDKYRPLAESRGIVFAVNGECTVMADRRLVAQALENLIGNAVKYTDEGGRIDVQAEPKCITLANTFSGKIDKIPEELCRPFVRGDSSRTERDGSGMGLAIVKNICDLHGFKLTIDLDGGFTVKIKL